MGRGQQILVWCQSRLDKRLQLRQVHLACAGEMLDFNVGCYLGTYLS